MAGCVDHVQDVGAGLSALGVVGRHGPRHPHGLALDGDPALALDVHPVEVLRPGGPLVDDAGELEHPVGQRRLAVVDVRDDAEVADDRGIGVAGLRRGGSSHGCAPLFQSPGHRRIHHDHPEVVGPAVRLPDELPTPGVRACHPERVAMTREPLALGRRTLLRGTALTSAAGLALGAGPAGTASATARSAPALIRSGRPTLTHGVQAGDVRRDGALLWSRADRPSRLIAEISRDPDFRRAVTVQGPVVTPRSDLTGEIPLRRLPSGADLHYRIRAVDLDDHRRSSAAVTGRFRTAPGRGDDVRFLWSGDIAGQGWGVNPDFGRLPDRRRHALAPGRLLPVQRRQRVRRRAGRRVRPAARRLDLAQPHDPGQVQGRRDARRVPRAVPVQPVGGELAGVPRRDGPGRRSGTTTR